MQRDWETSILNWPTSFSQDYRAYEENASVPPLTRPMIKGLNGMLFPITKVSLPLTAADTTYLRNVCRPA